MKIAFFSDTHLGYARFEEDAYLQAERAIEDANGKADILVCTGDVFDTKIPKLETLKRSVEIFNKAKIPFYVIFGNHERRAKGLTNPVQLLASSTKIKLLHGTSELIELNGEKTQIFGMGSVPEEYAREALAKVLENFKPDNSAFKILLIHQTIQDLVPIKNEEELSFEDLEHLPFDLIVNGHIHDTTISLGGRFLIPGSTVITQMKKEQMAPRGYFLFDTRTKSREFIEIKSRKFIYEELEFENATVDVVMSKLKEKIEHIRNEFPDSVMAIKLRGTMVEGSAMPSLPGIPGVFVDNKLDSQSIASKVDRIREMRGQSLSARETAISELRKKTDGKITLFNPSEFFDILVIGPDEAMNHLESKNNP